jgi:hypothetical protein
VVYGFVRALDEALKAGTSNKLAGGQQSSIIAPPPLPPPQRFGNSWNPRVTLPPPALAPTATEPFVGNLVLGIYHLEGCDWVGHISSKNRVSFSTASEAISHGFKPCQICSPAA